MYSEVQKKRLLELNDNTKGKKSEPILAVFCLYDRCTFFGDNDCLFARSLLLSTNLRNNRNDIIK